MWALRLDDELFAEVKRRKRGAAPWVRALMYEALKSGAK